MVGTMKNKRIPPTTLAMAAGMLAPYVIGMTPAALQGMLDDAMPTDPIYPNTSPGFLTPKQFAAKMKVSHRTVQNWMIAGLIPGVVRISPRVVRIPENAFLLGQPQSCTPNA